MRVMDRNDTAILPTSRGSMPMTSSAKRAISSVVALEAPKSSLYSDQPTNPSSVVSFRNEKSRHPASAFKVSTLAIFIQSSRKFQISHFDMPGLAGHDD